MYLQRDLQTNDVTTDLSCLVSPVLKGWVFLKKEKKEKKKEEKSKLYQFEAIV